MPRYFLDSRINKVVQDLDTTYLAPELYLEIEVGEGITDVYKFTFADPSGEKRLNLMLSLEEMSNSLFSWQDYIAAEVTPQLGDKAALVDKRFIVSEEHLKAMLEENQ